MTLKTPGMHYINPIGLTRIPISIKATNMDIGGANYPIKVADGDGNVPSPSVTPVQTSVPSSLASRSERCGACSMGTGVGLT